MIDLYYWTTPNGHKITIFLEETGLPYKIFPINIGKGEQFQPHFLKVVAEQPYSRAWSIMSRRAAARRSRCSRPAPSCSISARRPDSSCRPSRTSVTTSCSGCSGRWAASGRWPGRTIISAIYAVEKLPYAIKRYEDETNRLYGVMNKRLADRPFLGGEYSIADMASYPWIVPWERQGQKLADFPHLKRWFETIEARPGGQARLRQGKRDQSECRAASAQPRSARSCLARPPLW